MSNSIFLSSRTRISYEFVCLCILVMWLSGCAGRIVIESGNANLVTGNAQQQIIAVRPTAANNFAGCANVCNALGSCTYNPQLFAQYARSVGAYCVGNGNSVTGNQQIHNCRSGGQGTAEQCRANDAAANGNQNNQNGGQIYNCKSGGTGTRDQCLARDAGANNNSQDVKCKSGGTQRTIYACQQQDLRLACAEKNNKQACEILKRM